jgi:hypothetical protein
VPNPDSRIMLDNERDALGMPRIRLDWRLTEQDKSSLRAALASQGVRPPRGSPDARCSRPRARPIRP